METVKVKEQKAKLLIKPLLNPMAILAICSACNKQVVKAKYDGYAEFRLKKRKYEKTIKACPYCGSAFHEEKASLQLAWRKSGKDYVSDCENGRFIVFKWGHAWRWSFCYYSEETPRAENTGLCFAIESAKRVCEKHKEWK